MTPTPSQLKAARILLGWTRQDVASKLRMPKVSIGRAEGKGVRVEVTADRLAALYTAAGVEFTNGGEPGVKLRRTDASIIPIAKLNASNDK